MGARKFNSFIVAAGAMLLLPGIAGAADQTVTWLGGNGPWSDATKWSGGVVPNNSPDTTYSVQVDGLNPVSSVVQIGGSDPPASYVIDGLIIDAGDELSMGGASLKVTDNLNLQGSLSLYGSHVLLPPDSVIAPGATWSLYTASSLASASGSLTIEAGAAIPCDSGSGYILELPRVGSRTTTLINHADLSYSSGQQNGVIFTGSSIDNEGSFTVTNNATVGFDTDSTLDQLGKLVNNGGRFAICGTLENAGQTFRVDHNSGQWALAGTIHGGTIETGDGMSIVVPFGASGRIYGAQINGRISVTTSLAAAAGTAFQGSGEIFIDASASAPEGGGFIHAESGDTVIGPGLTVDGGTTIPLAQISGDNLINHGTIRANAHPSFTGQPGSDPSPAYLQLAGASIFNDGTLGTSGASKLIAQTEHLVFLGNGKLRVNGGGELDITGDLDLSTDNDFLEVFPRADGQPYTDDLIATYGKSLSGIFDHVTLGITVDYSTPGQILISGTPVPEPAGIMALLGLSGWSGLLRRRRRR